MAPSAKTLRDVKRTAHLVASFVLVAYLYTPFGQNEVASVMVRAMVVPMLAATGLVMWQMPRIRRLLRRQPAATVRST